MPSHIPPNSSSRYDAHYSQNAQQEPHAQQTPQAQRAQRAQQEDPSSPTFYSEPLSTQKTKVPPNEQANIRLAQIMFCGGIFSGRYGVDQLNLGNSDPSLALEEAYVKAWQEAIEYDGL